MKLNRILLALILISGCGQIQAQPVITPWGNIKGFIVEGEKMNFETSVRSVNTDWSGCNPSEENISARRVQMIFFKHR